ncbi:MAG TPA: flagellar assembly protein FliW, partial [Clostridiales bacterium]|nr:flagellar assembly protein FliW [Clostridiales bacterium]
MYNKNRNIKTRDFDEITVNDNDVIKFITGMYGFEQYKEYVILKDSPEDDVMFLQSLSDTDLSFVLIDPYSIIQDYNPYLNEEDLNELKVKNEADLKYL